MIVFSSDDESEASDLATSHNVDRADMAEDDFLICCLIVLSFSLADKWWGKLASSPNEAGAGINALIAAEFAVADIKEIQWSSDSFNSLVISNDDRELIMAVVEARDSRVYQGSSIEFEFDDIIPGKGRGLNILLQYSSPSSVSLPALTHDQSGSPGLGKTLTAEAVSEHLKRLLYSV